MATGYSAAYGMDLSGGRAVLVRATRRGAGQVLWNGPAEAGDLRSVWAAVSREVGSGRAALAVGVPAAQTVVRRLRAPFASARKAARVWPSLLDVELPFPLEAAVCAFADPRRDGEGMQVVAAAIRRGDLEALGDTASEVDAGPTHADAEALALWDQLVHEIPPVRPDHPRMLAWVTADHVTLVRGRGTEFMAVHVLRASPLAGDSAAREAFEVRWASRLAPILSEHRSEAGSAGLDLWWGGPGAADEKLLTRLRRGLPPGTEIRHETLRQPETFLARALARRAVTGMGINFRTGEYAHPARLRREARQMRAAYGGVAAAALLVLGLNLGDSVLRQRRDALWQRRLTVAAEQIAGPGVPHGQEMLMVERALSARDEATRPFRGAMDPEGLETRLIQALQEIDALDIEISRLSMSPLVLTLEGRAPSIQALEGLTGRLQAQGWAVQSDTPGRTPEGHPLFILKGARHHEG